VYAVQKESLKASQQYALAEASYASSRASGVNTDLEESLFLSDRDLNVSEALSMAKRAFDARPSMAAADALSFAYYKNGMIQEASKLSKASLQLGSFDPYILYHQGIIARQNGQRDIGDKYISDAFALHPHFSILFSK